MANTDPEFHRTVTAQNRTQLRLFLLRLLLFALPLLLITAPPVAVLVLSGEAFRDLEPVLQQSLQQKQGLIGFAWNEQNYPWMKRQAVLQLPPQQILALGSSRVLQFRREMFNCPFWNAGYTIVTAADFRTFLSTLPAEKRPRILLITLDQWMFNSNWLQSTTDTAPAHWTQNPSFSLRTGLRLLPDVLLDLIRGRISVSSLAQQRNDAPWGLNAWQNAKGFRPDGSFAYGRQIQQRLIQDPATPDFQFSGTLQRVAAGSDRFAFGETPDAAAVEQLRVLLQTCSEQQIHVVACLPPFANAVATALQDSGRHQYLQVLPDTLQEVFRGTPHELHCFPALADCEADDSEAIDGFHAGEKATLRQLLRMLQQGSRLNACCNTAQLSQDLAAAPSALEVYP